MGALKWSTGGSTGSGPIRREGRSEIRLEVGAQSSDLDDLVRIGANFREEAGFGRLGTGGFHLSAGSQLLALLVTRPWGRLGSIGHHLVAQAELRQVHEPEEVHPRHVEFFSAGVKHLMLSDGLNGEREVRRIGADSVYDLLPRGY